MMYLILTLGERIWKRVFKETYYISIRIYFKISDKDVQNDKVELLVDTKNVDDKKIVDLDDSFTEEFESFDRYDYKTSGEQIILNYLSEHRLNRKIDVVVNRVEDVMSDYNIDLDSVKYIILEVRRLRSEFITDISLNNELINKKDKKFFKTMSESIPLTIDETYLGEPIKQVSTNNGIVTSIIINTDGNTFNVIDEVNNNNKLRAHIGKPPIVFDAGYNFYLRGAESKEYILCIKESPEGIIKQTLDIHTGDIIKYCVDDVLSNGKTVRTINNRTITIDNNKVQLETKQFELKPIKKSPYFKKIDNIFRGGDKQKFGVFDLETYTDYGADNTLENVFVYAGGVYIKNVLLEVKYAEKDVISHQIIINMLDLMFMKEHREYEWYCHNFAKYDSFFFIGAIYWYNNNQTDPNSMYKMYPIMRNGFPIKLTISKLIGGTWHRINLKDSLPILPSSLRDLAKSFNVDEQKGYFPYRFVSKNTLFYVGNVPEKKYYESISDQDYEQMLSNKWSLKDMCIEYTIKDLKVLHDVLAVANRKFYTKYNIQMTENLTISKMALNLFLKTYYKNNIPLIDDNKMYQDIKSAYYGGCTEVYKPYGKNLYYYDVNSLYPFASINDMPGMECKYISSLDKELDIEKLFGFFYCEIESSENYFGLLPYRSKQGLIYPSATWSGWYFSEELKHAIANGYKIKVLRGYEFSREKDIFKNYVTDLYKHKSESNDVVMKNITKLLLNSLLGRFGLNILKDVTDILDNDEIDRMRSLISIKNERPIGPKSSLVTYTPGVNMEFIKEGNLDIVKVKKEMSNITGVDDPFHKHKNVSIVISAAVNSYARIYMSKVKKDILDLGISFSISVILSNTSLRFK